MRFDSHKLPLCQFLTGLRNATALFGSPISSRYGWPLLLFFFHGCDPLATRVYHEIKFSWVGLNVLREAPQNDRTSVSIRAASFPLIQPCTAHAACLDTPVFRAKSWLVVWMALIFLPSSNLTTHADGTYWKRTMIWTNQYARLSIACKVSEGV